MGIWGAGILALGDKLSGKEWEEMSAQLRAEDEAVLLTIFSLYTDHLSNKTMLDSMQGREGRVM